MIGPDEKLGQSPTVYGLEGYLSRHRPFLSTSKSRAHSFRSSSLPLKVPGAFNFTEELRNRLRDVGSPLGTEAWKTPLLVYKSTSAVGIPLLSRICRASIFVITEGIAFSI
ncbi:hypothetical protein IC582_008585 [Cucumis melo]|uniref:Uncharacterized protein LOC103502827 n=1 Tax=Cucumis melo TaxID=3656 RepID=A0ABM3KPT4_CUCME|nr:uncharacterized protein LOC103502827 [Cucumis melo]